MNAHQKIEAKACRKLSAKIAKRQSIGDPNCTANDNVAWPLSKALLAEGNTELLKPAMAYRRIEASATSGAELRGESQGADYMALDQRTWMNAKGEVVYKGARRLSAGRFGSDLGQTKQTPGEKKPAVKAWKGDDKVNQMIDDQRTLEHLRRVLGPLVEPFEALVLDSKTYEQVGREMGVGSTRGAQSAARAVVHLGLIAVRDALGMIKRSDCVN